MKKAVSSLIYFVLFLLFLLSLLIINRIGRGIIEDDVSYHSEALVSYAWDLDYSSMEIYMKLVVKSRHYIRALYRDMTSESVALSVNGEDVSPLEGLLLRSGLVREREIVRPVVYNGEILGELAVVYFSRNIFLFPYALLIYVLIHLVLVLNINLFRVNESLEGRIALRTEDLEREVSARRRAEGELRLILDSVGEGVIATDRSGLILMMNPTACVLTGWAWEEAQGQSLCDVLTCVREGEEGRIDLLGEIRRKGAYLAGEGQDILTSRKGEEFRISQSGYPIRSEAGEVMGAVIVFRDVSREYRLRLQLEHGQRMEAVGQLAGGIAHDFNNMLGGIIGSAELLQSHLAGDREGEELNSLILETGERAAQLTGQLLTFSRKQKVVHSPVDLHVIIEKTTVLLKRTIDKGVEIRTDFRAEQSLISGDPAMLQNSFLNLGINASHAMPEGGVLTFRTGNLVLDGEYCSSSSFDLEPASYVLVSVEDTGTGIPAKLLPRIFEPFFTTKDKERGSRGGTGLGLTAVYGTVQQHRGEIRVYSEPGLGTSFHLSFPLAGDTESEQLPKGEKEKPGKGETILLIDDEESIRLTVGKMLMSMGYRVLTAPDGQEGLELFLRSKDDIDLVLLDMIMPRMNGRECYYELRKVSADIPVIMASGFSRTEDIVALRDNGLNSFLAKPYRMKELNSIIRENLS